MQAATKHERKCSLVYVGVVRLMVFLDLAVITALYLALYSIGSALGGSISGGTSLSAFRVIICSLLS